MSDQHLHPFNAGGFDGEIFSCLACGQHWEWHKAKGGWIQLVAGMAVQVDLQVPEGQAFISRSSSWPCPGCGEPIELAVTHVCSNRS